MHDRLISALLLIIAAIHLTPVIGVFGTDRLASLYGITVEGNDLVILMRHRAVLFGILGCLFAYAAFHPVFQPLAFLAAFASVGSFFLLAFLVGDFNEAIRKVVIADVVAAVALAGAVVLTFLKPSA